MILLTRKRNAYSFSRASMPLNCGVQEKSRVDVTLR